MTITLFSLAYTTIYALVLICGHLIVNRIALFSSSERAPLALISAGIGFAIVGVVAAIAVIYSVARFGQRWTRAGFYCFVLMLQPVFTLLAVLMKRTDVSRRRNGEIARFTPLAAYTFACRSELQITRDRSCRRRRQS